MSTGSGKKELNFELELLPIISVLAVCICFLLFSTAWIPLAVIKTEQAFGEGSSRGQENPASIMAAIKDEGDLDLQIKDAKSLPTQFVHVILRGRNGDVNKEDLNRYLDSVKKQVPDIKVAVVMPHHSSKVDQVIQLMDQFRRKDFTDVGVSPF